MVSTSFARQAYPSVLRKIGEGLVDLVIGHGRGCVSLAAYTRPRFKSAISTMLAQLRNYCFNNQLGTVYHAFECIHVH